MRLAGSSFDDRSPPEYEVRTKELGHPGEEERIRREFKEERLDGGPCFWPVRRSRGLIETQITYDDTGSSGPAW
jgi:hypothetical protein